MASIKELNSQNRLDAVHNASQAFHRVFRRDGYDDIHYNPAYVKSYNRFLEAKKNMETYEIEKKGEISREAAGLRESCKSFM